jgi:NAD(P)H-nitrite reductase large subunit
MIPLARPIPTEPRLIPLGFKVSALTEGANFKMNHDIRQRTSRTTAELLDLLEFNYALEVTHPHLNRALAMIRTKQHHHYLLNKLTGEVFDVIVDHDGSMFRKETPR